MRGLSLADALKDFGAGPPRSDHAFSLAAMEEPAGFPPMAMDMPLPDVEPVDVDALIAGAVAAAEQALNERLAQEHAAALQAEKDLHAEEVARLQQHFADEGLLSDDLRDRSIDRLAGLIREALRDGEAVRIRIHGSPPLFEALKQKLPDHAGQFDFMESPDFDLSVAIDESVYETRLAEWSAALAEILA
jgi:hypothetical protein